MLRREGEKKNRRNWLGDWEFISFVTICAFAGFVSSDACKGCSIQMNMNTVFPIYSLFSVGGMEEWVGCNLRRRGEADYCASVDTLMLLGKSHLPLPYTLLWDW